MLIAHIASELAPIAKVGGLGDVVYGLSRETLHQHHKAIVILPKYNTLEMESVEGLHIAIKALPCNFGKESSTCSIWSGKMGGIPVYFIDSHHPSQFFNRGCIYGCVDDTSRFLHFSRAALEFLFHHRVHPDVIHLHDWLTAAVAPLYRDLYQSNRTKMAKLMLTIHNMEYQGRCSPEDIAKVGLKASIYHRASGMQDKIYPEAVNLLKGGILYSDFVTTVSPTYAEEVKTPEFGHGLNQLLVKKKYQFAGVINGIDYEYWNPATDPYLASHFSANDLPKSVRNPLTLDQKGFLKNELRSRLCLDHVHRPIIASVTRLVPQKGEKLIKHAIQHTVDQGGQFVLLGTSPIPAIDEEFHKLKRKYTDHPHIYIHLQHQEELAHQIFAGSDIFIIPSLFEPCGLTQMIALRYGTIPLVRRTGGLQDTIFDVDHSGKPFDETNGYTFDKPSNEALDSTLRRAIHCWYKEPDKWRKMVQNGMKWDFSWKNPTKQYLEIYRRMSTSKIPKKREKIKI